MRRQRSASCRGKASRQSCEFPIHGATIKLRLADSSAPSCCVNSRNAGASEAERHGFQILVVELGAPHGGFAATLPCAILVFFCHGVEIVVGHFCHLPIPSS